MTPDEFTNEEFFLDVGDGHRLYVHDWGNSKAKLPIIYLHGGPGNGCSDRNKTPFDPTVHRVIFHDQRGAGKSSPYLNLEHNTTNELADDIEKIAKRLKLDKFILAGGSWGSCLGLVYAIKHPGQISALVLWGIFTGTAAEREWLAKGQFSMSFPDVWETYLERTPELYRKNPTAYHLKNISENTGNAKKSAYAYENMEYGMLRLDDRIMPEKYDEYEPGSIVIEAHYALNKHFLTENYVLDNVAKLSMPVWLVQGRYDMICPPVTAYNLSKSLPSGKLIWTTAGHSSNDRANYDVLRTVFAQLAEDT